MRKNKSLLAVLLLSAFALSACNLMPQASRRSKTSQTSETEIVMPEAYQIYQLYLSSGGTLTYEEWLESVRGEPGQDGHSPVVTIGNNGHWYIDGKDTGINAQGDQGERGDQGDKGDTGEKGDTGDKGDNGKSAYEQYVEAHPEYTKSEEEWLDDLINGRLGVQASYTVSFNSNGGTEVADQTIYHGEKVSKPADPVKAGYTFIGWYYNDEPWSFGGHVVTSDMVIEARWKAIDYVAIFYNDDGTILDQQDNVHYGDRLVYQGETPAKPNPEDHYVYTFAGWDKELTVDGDMVFTAQYSREYAPFEERYYDYADNLLYNRFIAENDPVANDANITYLGVTTPLRNNIRIEAEDGYFARGVDFFTDSSVSNGTFIGCFQNGSTGEWTFESDRRINAKLVLSVAREASEDSPLSNFYEIKLNGSPVDTANVMAPHMDSWFKHEEMVAIPITLAQGTNTIFINTFDPLNLDYLEIRSSTESLLPEIEVPNRPNSGTIKYQFSGWDLVSEENNVVTYKAHYEEATIGLEFEGSKVGVYHGEATNVVVPTRWDGYRIASIGRQCFVGTNVESVSLPNSINLISESAFFEVATLKSINFPDSLTKIEGYAFQGCTKLEHISLNEGLTRLGNHAFDSAGLKEIILPSTLTFIDDNAFVSVQADYVYIPATVIEIRWYAFGTYDSNKAMTIFCEREYRPSTYEGQWAYGNSVVWGYKSVVEENGYKYAISEIEGETSATLISVDSTVVNFELPASINGVPISAMTENALSENQRIKTAVLPSFITSIPARMFHGCANLETITLHENVTSIGDEAFGGCKKLISFEMPDSVTSIGRAVFGDCFSLQSVKLSNQITELTDQLFINCDSLQFVDIPDSVTFISSRAFDNCEILTSVTMSSAIETIQNSAFTYSWNIAKIYCKCSEEKWNEIMDVYSHDYDNLYLTTAYFYSETTPTETGNYWHYVNGVPTEW